jgi:hypothetical protein
MYTELERNSHLQDKGEKDDEHGVEKIHRTYLGRRQNTLLMFTNWYSSPSESGDRSSKRVEDGTYLQRKDGP